MTSARRLPTAKLATTIATLLAAATALAGGHSAAAAQDLKVWKHGVIEPKGDGGFSFMVGQRDFAAKRGLKIEMVKMKSGSLAHRALLAGELDSIESSPGAAILAGARGADIKIVGCDWPHPPQGLMVRPNIGKVEDLKGKTVAVSAPGSLPNLLMGAILEKYHVPATDVKYANLGGDLDRYKAVVGGVADAGMVAVEFMAVAPKDIKMLVSGREALPNYVRLCVTTTGKTIAARRADAVGFVAAEMEALHFAVAHRDDTIKLTRELINAKPDDPRPAFVFDDTVKNQMIDPDLSLPVDKLTWMQGELIKAGNLKKPIDIAKIVDPSIRADAIKAGAGK